MTVEIKNMVEKIVFDEMHLLQLKEALNQLNMKKMDLKDVKQVILSLRTDMMESLIDLFFFYLSQQQSRSITNENSEIVKELQLKIKEREDLLEEIGKKLELITTKNSAIDRNQIKAFILEELNAVEIHSWLKVGTLLDFETGIISENYKFLLWLMVCVEKYYKYLFGENDSVAILDRIKALHLPKKLEDDFLIFAHNRNVNAHDIVDIPESFIPLLKNGFIGLFRQLINNEIFPRLQVKFQLPKTKKAQELKLEIFQGALISKCKSKDLQQTALSLINLLN
jgi:hypothetical protein